ncbi:hypothetical protein HELRODRAFT_168303 [Helobdella robusta]|uniref:Rho-GAP domain-containing protein n=1 Tax=Helobdella robusta TaxID=6412 RepID=T1F0F0_HELRO|nr:hypothetical protein HELRODRAFT_168303 [Helobdella robusta]ESO09333.1 hypothetical protein HELRODRAFT_168303 [Helobdella robusta]
MVSEEEGYAAKIEGILSSQEIGVELGLRQMEKWIQCCNDVIDYLEKKMQIDEEHSMSIIKISTDLRSMSDQLPLKKMLAEHDKKCKDNREIMNRQLNKLHEAVEHLKKWKSSYIQCNQELEEIEKSSPQSHQSIVTSAPSASSSISFSISSSYSTTLPTVTTATTTANKNVVASVERTSSRILRRKKSDNELTKKKMQEAEKMYMEAVRTANNELQVSQIVEKTIIAQLSKLMVESDATFKMVIIDYFDKYKGFYSRRADNFHVLIEQCNIYTLGLTHFQAIKKMNTSACPPSSPSSPQPSCMPTPANIATRSSVHCTHVNNDSSSSYPSFANLLSADGLFFFQSYPKNNSLRRCTERKVRKRGSHSEERPRDRNCKQTECGSKFGRSKSIDRSPDSIMCMLTGQSKSLIGPNAATKHFNANGKLKVNEHSFKALKIPSKCRVCESYCCITGLICTKCQICCHERCIYRLRFQCIGDGTAVGGSSISIDRHKINTSATKNADRSEVFSDEDLKWSILTCMQLIEEHGLHSKGIYRVSGSKLRSGSFLQTLLNKNVDVDFSDVNTIANTLKVLLKKVRYFYDL